MVFQLKKSREDLDLLVSIEKRDPETTISSLYNLSAQEQSYLHDSQQCFMIHVGLLRTKGYV